MPLLSSQLQGVLFVFVSALLYSTLPILCKIAYASGLTSVQALLLRYLIAFMVLSLYLGFRWHMRIVSWKAMVLLQGLVMISSGLCFFNSLQFLSAGLTIVIFFSHPVLVAILAILIFKEPFRRRVAAGITLAVSGLVLVSGLFQGHFTTSAQGLAWIVAASVLYALYSLIGQRTVECDNPLVIANSIALVSICFLGTVFREAGFLLDLSVRQVLAGLGLGLLDTVLAISFFLKGVQKIGATRATLVGSVEPVLTIILAFFLLGERLDLIELIGSGMVLASMFFAISPPADDSLPAAETEHI